MSSTPSKTNDNNDNNKEYPLKVAFIHPDLGIGGAEQLVIN